MNKTRFFYMDMLKAISTFIMVLVHLYAVSGHLGMQSVSFPAAQFRTTLGILYLIGPVIFMFCMGCSLVLTGKNTPGDYALRGLHLLLVGFLLNVFRAFPFLISFFMGDVRALQDYVLWLLGSDILYFVGLFFLLFALIRKLGLPDAVLFATALGLYVLSLFIRVPVPDNEYAASFLGNFIYIREDSYFPFPVWTMVPVLGYLFKKEYLRREDPSGFIKMTGLISLCVLTAVVGLLFITGNIQPRYFLWGEMDFHMDFFPFIITVSVDGVFICLIYLLSGKISSGIVHDLAYTVSRNLNRIYCIHWILLINLMSLLSETTDFQFDRGSDMILMAAGVFTVSLLLSIFFQRLSNTYKTPA